MYTFRQMQDMVLEEINYQNDTAMRDRVKSWINMIYLELFDALLPETANEVREITLCGYPPVGTPNRNQKIFDYAESRTLPPYIAKIHSISICPTVTDNWKQLKYLPPDKFFLESNGWFRNQREFKDPECFTISSMPNEDLFGIGGAVKIVSSDASDTTQYVSICGMFYGYYTPGSVLTTGSMRLNGTTPVSFFPTQSMASIISASKDRPTVGNVEIYREAIISPAMPKHTIIRMAPEELMCQRLTLLDYPFTNKDWICKINYRPRPAQMEKDTDTAFKLPNHWYPVLVLGAKAEAMFMVADKRYDSTRGEFVGFKQELSVKQRITENNDEGFSWE